MLCRPENRNRLRAMLARGWINQDDVGNDQRCMKLCWVRMAYDVLEGCKRM